MQTCSCLATRCSMFLRTACCEIWAPWRIVVLGEGGGGGGGGCPPPSAPPARLPHPSTRPPFPSPPPAHCPPRDASYEANLVAGALVGRVVDLLEPSLAISEEHSDLLDGSRDGVLVILLLVAKTREQVLA